MTPEAAVNALVTIISPLPEFSEDDVYAVMAGAGIPTPIVDRAYKFTQIAWGRAFLDGLGIQFAPDYICFNGAGDVIESGILADEPYFRAAVAAAKEHADSPGFRRLALMSADVDVINGALNRGSKPEGLITTTSALFMEAPSPEGLEKAQKILSERTKSSSNPE